MIFPFGRRQSAVGHLFKGTGSAIGDMFASGRDKLFEIGKKTINSLAPRMVTQKLSEMADKTGISNVIGKDLVKTGLDFVGKNIGNVI